MPLGSWWQMWGQKRRTWDLGVQLDGDFEVVNGLFGGAVQGEHLPPGIVGERGRWVLHVHRDTCVGRDVGTCRDRYEGVPRQTL